MDINASGAIRIALKIMRLKPKRFFEVFAGGLLLSGLLPAQDSETGSIPQQPYDGTSAESYDAQTLTHEPVKKKASSYPKVIRYARHLLAKYDFNRDGVLQPEEWKSMHGHPELIARYGDGVISLDTLANWIVDYGRRKRISSPGDLDSSLEKPVSTSSPTGDETKMPKPERTSDGLSPDSVSNADPLPPENQPVAVFDNPQSAQQPAANERRREQKFYVSSKRLPAGLPDWFFERDKDGDGQLTANEYCTTGGAVELAEFEKLDANGDGVITAKECVRKLGGKPASAKSSQEVLPEKESEKNPRGRRKPRVNQ